MTQGRNSPLGSLHSSQDSLHKHSKKKGLKSSLGRFFSKKDKQKTKEAYAREMAAGKIFWKLTINMCPYSALPR